MDNLPAPGDTAAKAFPIPDKFDGYIAEGLVLTNMGNPWLLPYLQAVDGTTNYMSFHFWNRGYQFGTGSIVNFSGFIRFTRTS